jgi:hypothetical protein
VHRALALRSHAVSELSSDPTLAMLRNARKRLADADWEALADKQVRDLTEELSGLAGDLLEVTRDLVLKRDIRPYEETRSKLMESLRMGVVPIGDPREPIRGGLRAVANDVDRLRAVVGPKGYVVAREALLGLRAVWALVNAMERAQRS